MTERTSIAGYDALASAELHDSRYRRARTRHPERIGHRLLRFTFANAGERTVNALSLWAVRFTVPPRPLEEDLKIRETISVGRKYAFEAQDAPVIEAQQARMNEVGNRRLALLEVDAGAVRVQRVLAKLVAEEQTGAAPERTPAHVR